MDDVKTLPPPNRQIANYPLTVAPVRYVVLEAGEPNERALVYTADVLNVLGLDHAALDDLDENERASVALYEGTQFVSHDVLTLTAIRRLVELWSSLERQRFVTWVETELTPKRAGHRAPNPRRTKWGWQPIRDLVRTRGYTARRFTEEANTLDLPVGRFNQGNYIAWAYGGCLPAESLVVRACELLQVHPTDLFNADVLAAYPNRGKGRRRRAEEATGA